MATLGKLPGYKHSKSNIFTKVEDVAHGIGAIKGFYDAGRVLYNIGRTVAPMIGAVV